jgi:hypothetical protein
VHERGECADQARDSPPTSSRGDRRTADTGTVSRDRLLPEQVLALQCLAGNRSIAGMLAIQRGILPGFLRSDKGTPEQI